jgi:Protein of unknown function (DUF2795)
MADVNPIVLQKHLGGVDYPASKDDLVKKAEQNGAADDALKALRGIPDREYDAPTAVTKAVRG